MSRLFFSVKISYDNKYTKIFIEKWGGGSFRTLTKHLCWSTQSGNFLPSLSYLLMWHCSPEGSRIFGGCLLRTLKCSRFPNRTSRHRRLVSWVDFLGSISVPENLSVCLFVLSQGLPMQPGYPGTPNVDKAGLQHADIYLCLPPKCLDHFFPCLISYKSLSYEFFICISYGNT